MMNLFKKDINQLSIIQEPFSKDNIESYTIRMRRSIFDRNKIYYTALVSFKNGNTTGEQTISEKHTLEEVITELQAIFNSLK